MRLETNDEPSMASAISFACVSSRGLARTAKNIQEWEIFKNSLQLLVFNYCCKAFHLRCLQESWLTLSSHSYSLLTFSFIFVSQRISTIHLSWKVRSVFKYLKYCVFFSDRFLIYFVSFKSSWMIALVSWD